MGASTLDGLRTCPRCGGHIAPRIPGKPMPLCWVCFPPRVGDPYEGLSIDDCLTIVNAPTPVGPDGVRSKSRAEKLDQGCLVAGPFRVRWLSDDELGEVAMYEEGRGIVRWDMAESWATPSKGIPVEVTEGNRLSGAYERHELRRIG